MASGAGTATYGVGPWICCFSDSITVDAGESAAGICQTATRRLNSALPGRGHQRRPESATSRGWLGGGKQDSAGGQQERKHTSRRQAKRTTRRRTASRSPKRGVAVPSSRHQGGSREFTPAPPCCHAAAPRGRPQCPTAQRGRRESEAHRVKQPEQERSSGRRARQSRAARKQRRRPTKRWQQQAYHTGREPRGSQPVPEVEGRASRGKGGRDKPAQQREGQSTEERRAKAGRQRNSKIGPSRQLQADRLGWGEPQGHHLASREQHRKQKNQQCKRQSRQQQGKRQATWGGLPRSSRRDSIHWLF